MTALSITAGNVVKVSGATVDKRRNYGATITQGLAVYLDSNNEWLVATNATLVGAACGGIALVSGADGQPGVVQTAGDIIIGATVAIGKVYVLGTSGGIIPIDDATATGTVFATIIGIGISATTIRLCITPAGVEYADDVA